MNIPKINTDATSLKEGGVKKLNMCNVGCLKSDNCFCKTYAILATLLAFPYLLLASCLVSYAGVLKRY